MKVNSTMKVPPIALDREYQEIAAELDPRIKKVLSQGQFILSEEVQAFEQGFAKWIQAPHAVGVASGTDALRLALQVLEIRPEDDVITTPFTYFATIGAILHSGATPVFVDIDPKTFTMDVSKIEEKVHYKTRALIPVHLYGQPCDMDALEELKKKYQLVLIEDVAQAHGAEYKNQKTGTFGEAGCFSFYPTKNLGAYGDGGLITVGRDHLAEKIISLRTQGIASEDKYFHQELGTNSRLDELQAAILNVKMNYIEQWIEKRRKIARSYDEALKSEADWLETPVVAPDRTHVYHQYCIRTSRRDDLQKSLNEKGIAASPYYPYPMHLMPPLKKYGFKEGDFPEAERAAKEVLSLPCFPQMTQDELNYVIESVKSFRKSLK